MRESAALQTNIRSAAGKLGTFYGHRERIAWAQPFVGPMRWRMAALVGAVRPCLERLMPEFLEDNPPDRPRRRSGLLPREGPILESRQGVLLKRPAVDH